MEDNRNSTNTNPTTRPRGCRILLKSCLVITFIVVGLFIAGSIYVMRLPGGQPFTKCQSNMVAVAGAIQRYKDVNGHSPRSLNDLRKDFLDDSSVLRCPLDKTPGDAVSYIYHPNAGDNEVMLECDRHRLLKNWPVNRICISGDGSDISASESFRDAKKQAERQARRK